MKEYLLNISLLIMLDIVTRLIYLGIFEPQVI